MDSPARPSQAKMVSSTGGTEGSSPASSPESAASLAAMAAPKYGTLVPNRIFVGGISANTSEAELAELFSAYGNVKATKIIADRGGVSKGYGFVTFETEEEAKRLQQESECIVLRERKLNIAPAIKKQPFNRSFDGGTGSPPAVPTSTYYYTNGMGLPYQNGMTFYNTGAPAPGTAIAPPADPTALYQAAGVFGPQATASHQTFTPVMYPVPAPSLYMPQQYQYSPMPYEPYFPGTTAAGAPQFLYTTNGGQATTSGSGNGSGNSNSGTATGTASITGAGATSPPSAGPSSLGPSPPQFQTHFYGPSNTTASHHHPGAMAGGPHGPPPPPHQVEHLYYSYPPLTHAAAPPQPHRSGALTLSADQQLLIYSTEITTQPSINDSQVNQQEDTRSTSSHSEQLQQTGGGSGTATSDSGGGGTGGGGSGQPSDPSTPTTMLPLMPLKYPLSTSHRYPSFHPVHHPTSLSHQEPGSGAVDASSIVDDAPIHYRGVSLYPTPTLYIPHGALHHAASSAGASLLPTPPQQPYDLSVSKYRDYSKSGLALGSPYGKGASSGASPLLHPPPAYVKQFNGPLTHLQPAPSAVQQKYPRVTTPPVRLSHHHQYSKRPTAASHHHHHQSLVTPATYYFSPKSYHQYGTTSQRSAQQQYAYAGAQPGHIPPYAMPGLQKGYAYSGAGYDYPINGRKCISSDQMPEGIRQSSGRKSAIVNSYRGSNLTITASANPANGVSSLETSNPGVGSGSRPTGNKAQVGESARPAEASSEISVAPASASTNSSNINNSSSSTGTATTASMTAETETSAPTVARARSNSSGNSPPPTSYSPTAHPHPNLSPSPNPNQVQFFGTSSGGTGASSSQRYNSASSSSGLSHHHHHHQQQQQQQQQRAGPNSSRYPMTSSVSARGGGKSSGIMRQTSTNKYKMNGIVQSSGKLPVDDTCLSGGAGDAPPVVVRLPLTPPGTPQQVTPTASEQNLQLGDVCHKIQTLSL